MSVLNDCVYAKYRGSLSLNEKLEREPILLSFEGARYLVAPFPGFFKRLLKRGLACLRLIGSWISELFQERACSYNERVQRHHYDYPHTRGIY